MATPTPSSKPALNAATPQSQPHLVAFSSPVPRSVPSPAAQRGQAGKSPFNASSHAPATGSTATAMNHPTGGSTGSATRALLGSSPAPAMLNLESPLPGLTPSFSNMGGLFSSVGMGLTGSGLSGLGGLSVSRPPTEEERRERLEDVVAQVKRRPGRISLEGIRRLLVTIHAYEVHIYSSKWNGTTKCSTGGNNFVLDIKFDPQNRVSNVQVEIASASTVLREFSKSASIVVQNGLTIPQHLTTITTSLDRFADNLERLALLDNPTGNEKDPTFNGFEAIAGIYVSLRKLYEHEKRMALSLLGSVHHVDSKAELEVTCKRSGRPLMNARGGIGLYLDYWVQRGHVHSSNDSPQEVVVADGDRDMDDSKKQDTASDDACKVFTLSIECQGAGSDMYSPARISEAWISDQIERPPDDPQASLDPVVDWLDPPPTYQSHSNAGHSTSLAPDGSLGRLPNVRFVAKLQPPLVVPWEAMLQVLSSVGVPQETVITQCQETYFDAALLRPTFQDAVRITSQAAAAHKDVKTTKKVLITGEAGIESLRDHVNSLFIPKRDHGGLLQEIPFDHPRQLVAMMPVSLPQLVSNIFES